MAQDTRKDTRAPVSLKVRFKSATVDEFIEQYSTDISRGGIFIKSKSPMPVGTLLKFEFELKDNSPLIHGVGRVVWKRDPDPAKPDMPPGMGIKFIKMDSQSRAVVERIVGGRADGPDDRIATPARPQAAARAAAASAGDGGDEEQRTMVSKVPELMAQAIAQMPGGKEPPTVVAQSPAMPTMPTSSVAQRPPPPAQPTAEPSRASAMAASAPEPPSAPLPPAGPPGQYKQSGVHTVMSSVAPPADPPPLAARAASEGWTQPVAEVESEREELAYEPEPPPPRVTVRPSQPAMAAVRRSSVPPPAPTEEPKRNPFVYVLVALLVVGTATFLVMKREETQSLAREGRGHRDPSKQPPTKVDPANDPGTEPTKVPPDSPPNTPPNTPPTPAVAMGRVHIDTNPAGAEIWIGDASKGVGPVDLELPAGASVTIKARRAGYREASEEVTPAADAPRTVSLALEALSRVLAITSEPAGASIAIGGRFKGRTPQDVTLGAVTGPIEVRLTRTGSEPFSQTISLDEGWSEVDGKYRYTLSATLTAAAPRVQRPAGGGHRPPGGGHEPPGGGAEPPGGGAEPPGGGHEPPPPPPPPTNNSPVPDNPFGK